MKERKTTKSAVLVLIGFDAENSANQIILTKRTMQVERHKGEISFPGGFQESHDETLLGTAYRECEEEIGVSRKDISVEGPLPVVHTLGGVSIHPWVAKMELPYDFRLNQAEVDKIILLPLQYLLELGVQRIEVEIAGQKIPSLGITADNELVWGATAKILGHLTNYFK